MTGSSKKSKKGASEKPETIEAPKPSLEESPKKEAPKSERVTVTLSVFSQSYKKMAHRQFKDGEVSKVGNLSIAGKETEPGKHYELEYDSYLQALVKNNIFKIVRNSIYGRKNQCIRKHEAD